MMSLLMPWNKLENGTDLNSMRKESSGILDPMSAADMRTFRVENDFNLKKKEVPGIKRIL